ncbi:MAG TPA: carboxylate-amine ligase [Methylomirabilota bacterium]|jgi:carboxylate-amine ligase|nr:carboxylate-amine ligase [Methylomirabilota bacterium]
MARTPPSFSLGIEEEYLLVDRQSRDLVPDPPESMLEECHKRLEGRVSPEFLRCQIEVGTRVCSSLAEARADLAHLRATVAEVAGRHGLAPIAAATHPFASWTAQKPTDRARYLSLARDMQAPARRLIICGLHVHVGLEDPQLRIDLLGQIAYFLPHLLALSTSSPFWRGNDTGLKSYRVAVFNEMPRTGLPESFDSFAEYERHLGVLVNAGLIEDGTKLWWDCRPSARFPTLELRIPDICTRLDDGIAIAALYRCLLRMLWRLRISNQRWRRYSHMLINENRWRAQRYGLDEGLVDFGKGEVVPFADLLEEIIALTREDAEALGCVAEVERARDIVRRGTSAHRQLAILGAEGEAGRPREEALRKVVDWLIEETVAGL